VTNRILLVHNTMYYLKLHYLDLIQCFMDRGWEVCCVAPWDESARYLESAGARCIEIALSRRGLNPFGELSTVLNLYRVFRKERPVLIMNFSIKPSIYGSLAARAAKAGRVCSMITGLGYVFLAEGRRQRILAAIIRFAYRRTLRNNYRVFFQNPDDRDIFNSLKLARKGQSVVVNGTGIDTSRFTPRPVPDVTSGIRFLMIARLLVDKGIREYAQAASSLKAVRQHVRCSLLGPMDDNPASIGREELTQWVGSGAIEYLGETDDVAAVIANHHVFVLPSYGEGLPRATLEAMAMAKPVVTTDVPGCRETVRHAENGFLVSPKDEKSLMQAMERFVTDTDLVETMGEASRRIALEKFDVDAVNAIIVDTTTKNMPVLENE